MPSVSPDLDLVVVGDGTERSAIHAAAEQAGLGDRFTWYANLPRGRKLPSIGIEQLMSS